MTEQDVTDLATLTGTAFDSRFLQLMTEHGLGAAEIAQEEVGSGNNAAVRDLAAAIVSRESRASAELSRLR